MESNALWQAVNEALGTTLKISIQAQADYATVKLPTIVAGSDLPDILYVAPNSVIPELPTFFKSKMTDLTPYLSGDAIKEYPDLANIPTIGWRPMVFNNAIYGIPCANSLFRRGEQRRYGHALQYAPNLNGASPSRWSRQ